MWEIPKSCVWLWKICEWSSLWILTGRRGKSKREEFGRFRFCMQLFVALWWWYQISFTAVTNICSFWVLFCEFPNVLSLTDQTVSGYIISEIPHTYKCFPKSGLKYAPLNPVVWGNTVDEIRSSMVPAVGLLGNWNVVEASSGFFFRDVYPVRWIYNNFATLKNGYSILVEKKRYDLILFGCFQSYLL